MSIPSGQKIGIVTVLYNSDDVLPGFFFSLSIQQNVQFRLYVIDNGATDSGTRLSKRLSTDYGIDAFFVFNNQNAGVAKGNNQGIELALQDGCTQVLLANNDTEFNSTAIFDLWLAISTGEERVVTPKIMFFDQPQVIWYAGGHINAWIMRTPHYGLRQQDLGQYDSLSHVNYAPTCFMMLDASVFSDVGTMDDKYFVYYDDSDFVWRMSERGIHIRFISSVRVLHKVSTSTGGESSPFSVYYTNRNRVYFIRKNLRGVQRISSLCYMLLTRVPRLLMLPRDVAKRGWAGFKDGFRVDI